MAYVPLWEFTAHGGPEEFGFTRLNRRVMLPIAEGMTASITATDLDLVRPDAGEPDRLIAGYQAGEGSANEQFFGTWRQSVLDCRGPGRDDRHPGDPEHPRRQPGTGPARVRRDGRLMGRQGRARREFPVLADPGVPPAGPARSQPREVITLAEQQAEYVQMLQDKLAGQKSFEIYVGRRRREIIAPEALQPWLTNLWPLACQTCGEPLGSKADLSADGPIDGEKILISLHHSGCRPSGTTPPDGTTMSCPTTSFAAGYLAQPDGKPRRSDIPVMVINPSCEQLQLTRDASGAWRNATVEAFTGLGLSPARRAPSACRP